MNEVTMPDPFRPDFFAQLAADAATYAPSPEERAEEVREKLREVRRARLERAKPSILPEDFDAIVDGRLDPSTSALAWVQRLRLYQRRRRALAASGGGAPIGRPLNILAMCGLTGRGKTVAAAWLLAEEGGYYVTADELRRKVVSPSWKERDWLDHFCQGGCVVIDDVGTEFDVSGANLALFEVVNRRLSMPGAYTLITGNLLEEEFRARYDARTIRRIEHAGAIITVGGDDLRRCGA